MNVDLVVTVDRLPAPGETVSGGTFARHHGGKGANQAVAAARLGAEVAFVGAVGDDQFGLAEREALRQERVNVDRLVTLPDVATGTALIVVDRNGENQIAVVSGANSAFGREIWSADPGGDVFLAGFEVSDDSIMAGAAAAAASEMIIVINPAPARELPDPLLATQPILVLNEGEAQALTLETDPARAARDLARRSRAAVVVTLGSQGALVVDGDDVDSLPAPVVRAVDTTGAGDTFVGALVAELSLERPLSEAVRFAVHAASLSVLVPGAREGMPSRDAVARASERWRAEWDSNPRHEDQKSG